MSEHEIYDEYVTNLAMVAKIQIQMDRFLTQIEKFLSSTFIIAAEIRSDPPFIAEVLVAAFVFIIYILFLIDINKMIQRAHADQTDLLHNKHKNFVCSMGDGPIQDYYYNEMQIVEDYSSHIERLLSITPSDYIRQYKHKQRREDKKVGKEDWPPFRCFHNWKRSLTMKA